MQNTPTKPQANPFLFRLALSATVMRIQSTARDYWRLCKMEALLLLFEANNSKFQ
jgi:hypothetical protein